MRVHPAVTLSFRHQFNDMYEAIVVCNSESEEEQPVFKIFPDLQEFSSGDLFSPHAANAEFWHTVAVAMICKSSGRKKSIIQLPWNSG